MKPARFDYARPSTLEEAVALLAANGEEAKPIAGGQSLMPMLAFRLAAPRLLVDIGRITGLDSIRIADDGTLAVGALVRWRDIEGDGRLAHAHPLLAAATAHIAHYAIRNRGTVGGSLAHADPAAELPGVAVCCDGEIVTLGPNGRRTIAARQFFTGALTTALRPDELIVELRLPAWRAGRLWAFEEFARRRGDFALAGVALFYDADEQGRARNAHVSAIGVADTPVRLSAVETTITGQIIGEETIRNAGAAAHDAVQPDDDIHAPGDYRRALLAVLTERALARAAGIPRRDAA
jgi:aerobic carbon-monoxide dehydrogenase medium subunit